LAVKLLLRLMTISNALFDKVVKIIKGAHWHFLLKALSAAKRALGPSKKAPKRRNDFLRDHHYLG